MTEKIVYEAEPGDKGRYRVEAWVRGYKSGVKDTDDYMMGRTLSPEPNPYEGDGQ